MSDPSAQIGAFSTLRTVSLAGRSHYVRSGVAEVRQSSQGGVRRTPLRGENPRSCPTCARDSGIGHTPRVPGAGEPAAGTAESPTRAADASRSGFTCTRPHLPSRTALSRPVRAGGLRDFPVAVSTAGTDVAASASATAAAPEASSHTPPGAGEPAAGTAESPTRTAGASHSGFTCSRLHLQMRTAPSRPVRAGGLRDFPGAVSPGRTDVAALALVTAAAPGLVRGRR
jgi:hypothetical protein